MNHMTNLLFLFLFLLLLLLSGEGLHFVTTTFDLVFIVLGQLEERGNTTRLSTFELQWPPVLGHTSQNRNTHTHTPTHTDPERER